MSTRTVKKLLLSLAAVGALASITTGGTYALMNGETQNAGSAIASATLTMSNSITSGVNSGQTCTSQAGTGNSNISCVGLFTTSTLQYPGTVATVNVTITNTGSAPGYSLGVSMPAASSGAGCQETDTPGAGVLHGHGHPCGATGDIFYIQETTSGGSPLHCWYPSGGSTCLLTGTLNNFSTTYWYDPVNAPTQSLLDLTTAGTSRYGWSSNARYFVIGVEEGTDNTLQGETATFPLLWHLQSS